MASMAHIQMADAMKWPNKAPEPTITAVTFRAPSSTARASRDRGSSLTLAEEDEDVHPSADFYYLQLRVYDRLSIGSGRIRCKWAGGPIAQNGRGDETFEGVPPVHLRDSLDF